MRILLAEHHSNVLRALRALIAEKTEHEIVGEATDWDGLLEQAKTTKADLALLDWELPGHSNNTFLADLRTLDCCPKVIVLSSRIEVKEKALKAGADAFVSKGDSPAKLLEALEMVQQ